MRVLPGLILTMLMLPPLAGAAAPACTATSGSTVPVVVELYTSEGCDSCPPADRWLGTLREQAARGTVIPLAFHIDYWDYLGWKDRFADPAFGARHRDAASRGGAKVVYTPQVLLQGREFQQWRRTNPEQLAASGGARPARAELRVMASPAGARQVQVRVAGRTLQGARAAQAYLGLFESGLATEVRAGENKGVTLQHDFVVRRWLGPFAFDAGTLDLARTIELPADAVSGQSGIAVLAVDARGVAMQALALPWRDCAG